MLIKWVYESKPGKWSDVTDYRIEEYYQKCKINGKETGLVYHCFGNGWKTMVLFGEMKT